VHNNFHFFTSSLLRSELENAGIPTAGLDAEVMIGVFAIEGLLMHPLSNEQERTICEALAARWLSTPAL
jgi:TetR/AcrR family transcriptional regulator, cholesterol catabolism regulator